MSDFEINGIAQIGILVRSIDVAIEQFAKLFGIDEWNINHVDTAREDGGRFQSGGQDVSVKAKIAWVTLGAVELELIEPEDTTSVYAQFLETHGPGIHHLMFDTDDYQQTLNCLRDDGVEEMLSGELQKTRFQMFDTRPTLGLLSEFAVGDALVPDEIRKIDREGQR